MSLFSPAVAHVLATHLGPDPARTLHAASTADDQLAELLLTTAYEATGIEESLRAVLKFAARDLHEATSRLDALDTPNRLGVLQGRGPEVDLLTARHADQLTHLRRLAILYAATHTTTTP